MSDAFLSSDDFDEQAHQLYNEGRYDEALTILKEGITLYPHAVELHIGKAYAHLAREEFAWSRRSFETALSIDPDHEDGLAGVGETLLKLGDREAAMKVFERIVQLGFQDDHELMLQVGRALFREGLIAPAQRFFDLAASAHPESPDAAACLGYASHRLGNDAGSLYWLRRALELEPAFAEARIYLANLLYDRGETEAALHHLERTQPDDHFDELGIWRHIELKKSVYRLPDDDPELKPWLARLAEVAGDPDPDRHAAGRSGGLTGGRRHSRSPSAGALRHPAERAARDAEEAGAGGVAPGGHPQPARASGAAGTRSCSR